MFVFRFFAGSLITTCALALALAFTPAASAQDTLSFDIPSQSLPAALSEYARQSGLEMLYSPEIVAGRTSTAVDGDMTRPDALRQLLQGTGLEFEQTPSGGMMVGDEAALAAYRAELAANNAAGQNTIGQRQPGIEEIIVTGQKREERIQDVPIAISAFSPEELEAQKIEGGFDLLKGVPNVTFSKTNFTGYNFQIRGIGTQAVSATTDPAVAVSFNNTTLIVNRLFEQEYLDVERVEVLRGPQGTLFGRNATAGVINVISKKPELGVWDGMIDVEVGNYNTRRLRGFFNAPIGDEFAIRGAYASTQRDGFGYNEASETNDTRTFGEKVSPDVDNRDLWTGRLTLGWQPIDRLRINLLWERFEEDDQRVRTSKQLCHKDSADEPIGSEDPESLFHFIRAEFSQGCKPGSLYADEAYSTPNGASLPFVSGFAWGHRYAQLTSTAYGLGGNPYFADLEGHGNPIVRALAPILEPALELRPEDGPEGLCGELIGTFYGVAPIDFCHLDPYRGLDQSRDLRSIYSELEPEYRAEADIFELSFDLELTDNLLLSSQTVYVKDEYYASQDYQRFRSFPIWNDSAEACDIIEIPALDDARVPSCNAEGASLFGGDLPIPPAGTYADGFYADLSPGGVVCDPQLGCSNRLVMQDLAASDSRQYNQELRLVSSFAGDWNFSLGANFTRFDTHVDYFIVSNAFTHVLNFFPFQHHESDCVETSSPESVEAGPHAYDGAGCRYVDPNPFEEMNGEGHNYFRSANPYQLDSSALFGELYWNATETVKLTAGLRFTWDRKVFTPIPSQLLLMDYREIGVGSGNSVGLNPPGTPPSECQDITVECTLAGNAPGGRGSPANPDIVQEWREPTGRLVVDWQPLLDWTDETLVYASFSHGYKGGGANPPTVAPPSGLFLQEASGGFAAPPTFEPEYINAYELGTKNTLFGGALILNGTAFYYDYTDYQISKIVDRSAANENFDAEIWGLELETVFAPSVNWQFNAAIGWLQTEVAEGEKSIDLMDRTDGGNRSFVLPEPIDVVDEDGNVVKTFTELDAWTVVKPWITAASNCIAPTEFVEHGVLKAQRIGLPGSAVGHQFCPVGGVVGLGTAKIDMPYVDENDNPIGRFNYDPRVNAPNGAQGFFKDLGGNEMPNSPEFTVALGGQYNFDLTRDWRATARVDYYWQDQSFARIYNTEYDRLKSWSNTNLSFWVTNPNNGITVEGYVKNVFDETPITGTFLNSDDSGLTTNVFTLDPRLIGVSIRKEF